MARTALPKETPNLASIQLTSTISSGAGSQCFFCAFLLCLFSGPREKYPERSNAPQHSAARSNTHPNAPWRAVKMKSALEITRAPQNTDSPKLRQKKQYSKRERGNEKTELRDKSSGAPQKESEFHLQRQSVRHIRDRKHARKRVGNNGGSTSNRHPQRRQIKRRCFYIDPRSLGEAFTCRS